VPVAASTTSGALRDPIQHAFYDPVLFARLERQVAETCGRDRTRFHFI
jgi:hypothetical protein